METTDDLIRKTRKDELRSQVLCVRLLTHVLEKLALFIGSPVRWEPPLEAFVENAFRLPVAFPQPWSPALQLTLKGIISARDAGGDCGLSFGGTLFVYSQGKRMALQTGESFLDVEYLPGLGTEGAWSVIGWFKDLYGEYEEYDDPPGGSLESGTAEIPD